MALAAFGVDEEEALLDAIARRQLDADKIDVAGTVGEMPSALAGAFKSVGRAPVEPVEAAPAAKAPAMRRPLVGFAPSVTPLPAAPDLTAARDADAERNAMRGFEMASKQAIAGLGLQRMPTESDLVTQPGQAETQAMRDAATARQTALDAQQLESNARQGELSDRQLALQQLKLEAEGQRAELESTNQNRRAGLEERRLDIAQQKADTEAQTKDALIKRWQRMSAGAGAKAEAKKDADEAKAKIQNFKTAMDLRKEFNSLPEVKDFKDVEVSYRKIQNAAKNVSAAGDLSLIFGYMKMLDPGSTVREGEFANAQNAGGIDDRIRAAYNNVTQGQRLTDAQRADFLAQAQGVFDAQRTQFDRSRSMYRELAGKGGIDPNDVTGVMDAGAADQSRPDDGKVSIEDPDRPGKTIRVSPSLAEKLQKRGVK